MDIILAIGTFNSLVFAFIIFNKANKQLSDKILAWWMLLFMSNLFIAFLTLKTDFPVKIFFGVIGPLLFITHFPFLYVYTKSLTFIGFKMQVKLLLHFMPIILMIAGSLPYLHLTLSRQKQIVFTARNTPWYFMLTEVIFVATFIFYVTNTITLLKKHEKHIKNTFSYYERINLSWLKNIVMGFISLLLMTIIVFVLSYIKIFNVIVVDEILYSGLALMVLYVGYWGYKQGKIFHQTGHQYNEIDDFVPGLNKKTMKSDNGPVTRDDKTDKIIRPIINFMKEEKPFLDPELNIITLSTQLNLHPHKLSNLINSHLQQNFFDFINQYRVEEFKTLAADNYYKHYSILGLAYEAGFNSKASFNRIFKNMTGGTPSEYIKNKKNSPLKNPDS